MNRKSRTVACWALLQKWESQEGEWGRAKVTRIDENQTREKSMRLPLNETFGKKGFREGLIYISILRSGKNSSRSENVGKLNERSCDRMMSEPNTDVRPMSYLFAKKLANTRRYISSCIYIWLRCHLSQNLSLERVPWVHVNTRFAAFSRRILSSTTNWDEYQYYYYQNDKKMYV